MKNTVAEAPDELVCTADTLDLKSRDCDGVSLKYEDIIMAYVVAYDSTMKTYWLPELSFITEEMEGYLVLYSKEKLRYEIHVFRTDACAGKQFYRLKPHIPSAFLGYQTWLHGCDEQQFDKLMQIIDSQRRSTNEL